MRTPLFAMILALLATSAEAKVRELPRQLLWPAGAPDMPDWPGAQAGPVHEELRDNGESLYNVIHPTLQPFLPDPRSANGAAVIVAPGGSFRMLSLHHEGTRVARWLAAHGVAAFVLNYRLLQTPPGESTADFRKRSQALMASGIAGMPAVADGIEALRVVRAGAARWRIDPCRVGIIGFSAGGHVAGMSLLAARVEDRPAFAGLIYGMPFADPMPPIPLANLPLPAGTPAEPWLQPKPTPAPGRLPPMFLAMAQDDMAVGTGMPAFYSALLRAGYRPEFHLYEKGGHGFGMAKRGTTVDHWIEEFLWWLEASGFVVKGVNQAGSGKR